MVEVCVTACGDKSEWLTAFLWAHAAVDGLSLAVMLLKSAAFCFCCPLSQVRGPHAVQVHAHMSLQRLPWRVRYAGVSMRVSVSM